jgi:hypothetical protein
MTQEIRQLLLDLLSEYRELDFPANPELLKLHIDNATERITTTIEAEVAAKTDPTMELPDLPYFQIVCTGKPSEYWKSPIYDTKSLPLKLQAAQQQKGGEV